MNFSLIHGFKYGVILTYDSNTLIKTNRSHNWLRLLTLINYKKKAIVIFKNKKRSKANTADNKYINSPIFEQDELDLV